MKILITGGGGFIGSHVADLLARQTEHDLILLDRIIPPGFEHLNTKTLDLANQEALNKLFAAQKPDCVIHFAALTNAYESVGEAASYDYNNVVLTSKLIDQCLHHNVGKFIFASTSAVYGPRHALPITENAAFEPMNPYSAGKVKCEEILKATAKAHENFKYIAARFFMVVGSGDSKTLVETAKRSNHPIRITAQAALGLREKMVIFGDEFDTPDGTCIRDYIDVKDLARMLRASLNYLNTTNSSHVFNCGTGTGISLKQVVAAMKEISGVDFEVEIGPRGTLEYPTQIADISDARKMLGWEPEHVNLLSLCRSAYELEKSWMDRAD